jgi:hypothetical protein
LLAVFLTYFVYFSADFRDDADGFLEVSRAGRIGFFFSLKMSHTKEIQESRTYMKTIDLLCRLESIKDLLVS